MNSRGRVIVLGIMGLQPFAGIALQTMHYLEGLRRLGFEVAYMEDTGDWPFDPETNSPSGDCRYAIQYLSKIMSDYGFSDNWGYRSTIDDQHFGMSLASHDEWFRSADILINLSGATVLTEAHRRVPIRIYLETDPMKPQVEIAQGSAFVTDLMQSHTHHFTFGENIGSADCEIPIGEFKYFPTRQPIVVDWWMPSEPERLNDVRPNSNGCVTTVANWRQSGNDIEWNGDVLKWSKHHEFLKFLDLPSYIDRCFELSLSNTDDESKQRILENGWRLKDAFALTLGMDSYRDYIQASAAEFTVAKDQYTRMKSGWFSDRSASYLAAGKPVVTQDTGFGKFFPTGEGLFAFNSMEGILTAFDAILSDPKRSSRAASEIASEYFRAEKVVSAMIDQTGIEQSS